MGNRPPFQPPSRPRPRRNTEQNTTLTLKPGGAVCHVVIPMRPLRVYFQHIPGLSGLEENRGIAGLAYKLRVPGQPEISGETPASGKIELPGLRPGMVGELEILETRLWLSVCDYRPDESPNSFTTMTVQGAKRRLMVGGYYDRPFREEHAADTKRLQVPDDTLGYPEIEDAILRLQVDEELEPNGEIERREISGGKIDTSQQYGFHINRARTTIGRFHPDFIEKVSGIGGSAPPGTLTPCVPAYPRKAPPPDVVGQPKVREREIYDGQCFVPVRFVRYAPSANPKFDPRYPEPDERGYLDRNGPVVSVMAGSTISLRMLRLHVGGNTRLVLRSTDESVATVKVEPVQGIVDVKGVAGGKDEAPAKAVIEVRFDSASGPVLHRLHVEVYKPINVAVTVHLVKIGDANNPLTPPIAPSLNKARLEPMFKEFNDIWSAAGIRFTVTQWLEESINLDQAGAMKAEDFTAVTTLNWVYGQMNLYVVEAMIGVGIGWGACNTAVVAAERMHGGQPSTYEALVQTFAHEIGHFLGLWHPATFHHEGDNAVVPMPDGTTESHALEDYWSRRSLMYYSVGLNYLQSPLDATTRQRGRQDDVGYGRGVGGRMLCCKVVPTIVSSAKFSEVEKARSIAALNEHALEKAGAQR